MVCQHTLDRFVELLLKNNPGTLELLASPEHCIVFAHPLMAQFDLSLFLSKMAKETFAGYAMTQIKKATGLNKKIHNPHPKERKTLLDFCHILNDNKTVAVSDWLHNNQYQQEHCALVNIPHVKGVYALYYDAQQQFHYNGLVKNAFVTNIHTSSVPKTEKPVAHLYCNLEGYSTYCKEYHAYWNWVENRNESRYLTNQAHGADYDSKNMMHTIRLLQSADEIVTRQTLSVQCDNREELLKIKQGSYRYHELLEKANHLLAHIEQAFLNCTLPDEPDREKIITLLGRVLISF